MVEQIQVIMNMFEKIRSAYRKFLKYANRQSVTKKMKGLEGKRGTGLSLLTSDRTQENSMKHQQGRFKLQIRERLTRHWNRFSRENGHGTNPVGIQDGQHS